MQFKLNTAARCRNGSVPEYLSSFADHRPASVIQRNWQAMAENSSNIQRLNVYQGLTDRTKIFRHVVPQRPVVQRIITIKGRPLNLAEDAIALVAQPAVTGIKGTQQEVSDALRELNKKNFDTTIEFLAKGVVAYILMERKKFTFEALLIAAEAAELDDGPAWGIGASIENEEWLKLRNAEETPHRSLVANAKKLPPAGIVLFCEIANSCGGFGGEAIVRSLDIDLKMMKQEEDQKRSESELVGKARSGNAAAIKRGEQATSGMPGVLFGLQSLQHQKGLPKSIELRILSMLPAKDLVSFSQVSHAARKLAENTPVQGLSATLAHIKQSIAGFQSVGYHGASDRDAMSLYEGVKSMPVEQTNFDGRAQLGPGFYVTQGFNEIERKAAEFFANHRIAKLSLQVATQPHEQLFKVFMRGLQTLRSIEADQKEWWPEKGSNPSYMKHDMVTGNIDMGGKSLTLRGGERAQRDPRQIKINPGLLANPGEFAIAILPLLDNTGSLDPRYLAQLYRKLNPF